MPRSLWDRPAGMVKQRCRAVSRNCSGYKTAAARLFRDGGWEGLCFCLEDTVFCTMVRFAASILSTKSLRNLALSGETEAQREMPTPGQGDVATGLLWKVPTSTPPS